MGQGITMSGMLPYGGMLNGMKYIQRSCMMALLNWIIANPKEAFLIWFVFVIGVGYIISELRK